MADLVVIGFMGAGKSTAARRHDPAARDSDEHLEATLGEPIEAFFDREGERAFRAREEREILSLLDPRGEGTVALGGGALVSDQVRAALRRHPVVWLDVEPAVAWERVQGSGRPLAREHAAFRALHGEREESYAAAADAVVFHTDSLAGAARALRAEARPPGAKLLWARGGEVEYPVWAAPGLLESGFWPLSSRRFLVTDQAVAGLYADRVGPLAGGIAVEPGEPSKTVSHAELVWRELARRGATREDHVVALGGGVVGDLAGFCAATYQRGMPVLHVPTTLVAQVDSAYGGKTGVDLPEAKNYVGAYHQPAAVLLDHATLASLPAEERAAGYAEVVKTALIAGGPLWERVRNGAVDDEQTVLACARAKLRIVAGDERDGGRRQVLNLGHTVAHAIEAVTGYARVRHGEAVGLGLLAALRLSGQDALRTEVDGLLRAAGLPTRAVGLDADEVLEATRRDKKRTGEGPVPFVLVFAPGDVRPGQTVADDEVRAAVAELTA